MWEFAVLVLAVAASVQALRVSLVRENGRFMVTITVTMK